MISKELKVELWEYFRHLGESALIMSHYDLAKATEYPAETWKEFLNEPDVSAWIDSEISMLQNAELKKLVSNIDESNSVGKAQIINSLAKLSEKSVTKEGPIFIYCYIPPNAEQAQADNVVALDSDPFLRNV